MKTNTLTAIRERYNHLNQTTTIKDNKGKVKAVLTGYRQPRRTQKTITLRNKIYNLKFIN